MTDKKRISKKTIIIIVGALLFLCISCAIVTSLFPTTTDTAASPTNSEEVVVVAPPTERPPTERPPTVAPAGRTAESYFEEYGGIVSVYEDILSLTDCGSLQDKFNTAADNNDREEPGTEKFKITLGYMTATDDKMRAGGCYE
jgi:hypothetical protein